MSVGVIMEENLFLTNVYECPVCKRKLDCCSGIEEGYRPPRANDISMCLGCGLLMEFTDSMTTVKISPETLEKIKQDETVWHEIVRAQNMFNRFKEGKL
jgi:hypothetical protein